MPVPFYPAPRNQPAQTAGRVARRRRCRAWCGPGVRRAYRLSALRCGRRRSFFAGSSERCQSLPEMPLRRDEISNTARNHVLNALRAPASTVPDVRLVCRPPSHTSAQAVTLPSHRAGMKGAGMLRKLATHRRCIADFGYDLADGAARGAHIEIESECSGPTLRLK